MLRFEDKKGIEHLELSNDYGNTHLHMGYLMNQGTEAKRSYGFELRTNEWGAIRADKGLLITTYAQDFKNKITHDNPDGFGQLDNSLQNSQKMMKAAEEAMSGAKGLIGSLREGREQILSTVTNSLVAAAANALGVGGVVGGGGETQVPSSGDPAMSESMDLLNKSKDINKPIVSIVSPEGHSMISPKPVVISSGQSVSIHAKNHITQSTGAQFTQLVQSGMYTHVATGGQAAVVSSGDIAHTAATGAINLISKLNASMTSTAQDAHIGAKNRVLIEAQTNGVKITAPLKIELICGLTSLVMDGEKGTITMMAPNNISTESKEANILVKAKEKIRIDGKSGWFEFSEDFVNIGANIHLNPDKS